MSGKVEGFKTTDSDDGNDDTELHRRFDSNVVVDDAGKEQSHGKEYCVFSRKLKDDLCEVVDADFGLLEALQVALGDRRYDSLVECKGYARNDKLMLHLRHILKDDFFKVLQATSQQHVINFITQDDTVAPKCFPLTEDQRFILKTNMLKLVKLIRVDDLLPEIFASKCITEIHYDFMLDVPSRYERSKWLLRILLKRSQVDYDEVSNALERIGQGHVARVLKEGGGVYEVHADLSVPHAASVEAQLEANFKKWKDQRETLFNEWLRQATPEERLDILHKWNELGADAFFASIMEVKKLQSVAVYIHCVTFSAAQCLDKAMQDGKLKSVMEAVFSSILLSGLRCEIKELRCSVTSYNCCLNYFYQSLGCYKSYAVLPRAYFVRDEVEQLQPTQQLNLSLLNWPLELLEELLVRSSILIFKLLMKFTSLNADRLAIVTLLMVCQQWRSVLTSRTFIKQRIKHYFDHLCQPLARNVQHKTSLTVTEKDGSMSDRWVFGVATLDNELFVVSYDSSAISVFNTTSFICQQHIEVEGLNWPYDIATCASSRRVYIADFRNDSVWSIDWPPRSTAIAAVADVDESLKAMSSSFPAQRFIACDGYMPYALSVTTGRHLQLLVTPYSSSETDISNSLFVYDFEGKLSQRVRLPAVSVDDDDVNWTETWHAVQVNTTVAVTSTDNSFVVCRIGKDHGLLQSPDDATHAEVAEYNMRGERVRCYYSGLRGDCPQQVSGPCHIALIGDGRLLVADGDAGCVLLLNAELKLERILLAEQQLNGGKPNRLCYNSQTGLLYVGMEEPKGRVEVYQIY